MSLGKQISFAAENFPVKTQDFFSFSYPSPLIVVVASGFAAAKQMIRALGESSDWIGSRLG